MSNKPALEAFVVTEGKENDQSYWTKVGAAWPTKDGKGFTLSIVEGISVSGRIVLLAPKTDDDKKARR